MDKIFNPQAYLDRWYKQTEEEEGGDHISYTCMKKAFELVPECEWGIEIGCGPILLLTAFASKKVKNIIMTEYNTECFKYIEAWQN
jgi:hypothetical protein